MIALENTSRWPRRRNCRGRKASSATKLARKGKPLKLVFAPVKRISAVAICTTTNRTSPSSPEPKTIRASWLITDG